jgi:hypothetical protein
MDLAGIDYSKPPPDLAEPDLKPLEGPPDLAGVDLAGYPAVPVSFPSVDKNDGYVMQNTRLVTITYDDDDNRATNEAFGDFIFGSSYYAMLSNEYGFGGGMQVATLHWPAPTPTTQGSNDILDSLRAAMDAGMVPLPMDTKDDNVLYAIYIGKTGAVSDGTNGASCTDWEGYHSYASYNGTKFPYTIIADCGLGIIEVTSTASHEVIETVSDPYDTPLGYIMDKNLPDLWYGDTGQEIADMCDFENYTYEGGFALQPIWSNAAAAAGNPPCVPQTSWPYYGFSVSPSSAPTVAAGSTVIFTITGWSFSPRKNWNVDWYPASYSDLTQTEMKPTLSSTTINNGKSVTIKLTVPSTAKSGSVGSVDIFSDEFQSRVQPVTFIVQ